METLILKFSTLFLKLLLTVKLPKRESSNEWLSIQRCAVCRWSCNGSLMRFSKMRKTVSFFALVSIFSACGLFFEYNVNFIADINSTNFNSSKTKLIINIYDINVRNPINARFRVWCYWVWISVSLISETI